MTQRMNYAAAAPGGMKALGSVYGYVAQSGLPATLIELVYLRVSQINGCAYCIDMHSKDARALGESEQRLYALNAWRETPFYSERERAALMWTEELTLLSQRDVPDALYHEVSQYFSDEEMVNLTLAISVINSWNRFAVAFRSEPGVYQSKKKPLEKVANAMGTE